ncbi:holo-[acyl-carrier-protein] synthase [Oleidesulfovibrio sp.]|uniref:holo-[acyl-carrier-protein] synthase n=1 Tax=Oleidesulfovibrio sp. TaxID=2909707 RepID=UPI003A87A9AC
MIVGTGIDLTELDRIRKALERHPERFAKRILHDNELESLQPVTPARLAARFAAKEAAVKALGTGFTMGISFKDLEVYNEANGKPALRLHGEAREQAEQLGVTRIHLSLTHGRDTAAAVVILEN